MSRQKNIVIGVLIGLLIIAALAMGATYYFQAHKNDSSYFDVTTVTSTTPQTHFNLVTSSTTSTSTTSSTTTATTKESPEQVAATVTRTTTVSPISIFSPCEGTLVQGQVYQNLYFDITIQFDDTLAFGEYKGSSPTSPDSYRELDRAKLNDGQVSITLFNDAAAKTVDDGLLTTTARRYFSSRSNKYSSAVYDVTEVSDFSVNNQRYPVIYGTYETDTTISVYGMVFMEKDGKTLCLEVSVPVINGNSYVALQDYINQIVR